MKQIKAEFDAFSSLNSLDWLWYCIPGIRLGSGELRRRRAEEGSLRSGLVDLCVPVSREGLQTERQSHALYLHFSISSQSRLHLTGAWGSILTSLRRAALPQSRRQGHLSFTFLITHILVPLSDSEQIGNVSKRYYSYTTQKAKSISINLKQKGKKKTSVKTYFVLVLRIW